MRINAELLKNRRYLTQTDSRLSYQNKVDEIRTSAFESAYNRLQEKLDSLREWPENWDSHGSIKPQPNSIFNANRWIKHLAKIAFKQHLEWIQPHVSCDEDGAVVMEWWNCDKKLTVTYEALLADYISISNTDEEPEFAHGTLGGAAQLEALEKNHRQLLTWILS